MKIKGYTILTSAIFLSSLHAQQYWNTNGTAAAINAANWSTLPAGPFTDAYVAGTEMVFGANSTVNYVTTTDVGNFSINDGFTVTWTPTGTMTTGGAVRTLNVGTGSTLNFAGQAFSTAVGTGFIKSGAGTLITSNANAYAGGFTLNAGTVAIGNANALGNGGALTINGGTIRNTGTGAIDLSGKFTGGITIGGDFTLGDAVNFGRLTFNDAIPLGASNRTITANGGVVISGVISADPGVGLTLEGTGALAFTTASTYTGATTVNGGTLSFRTPSAKSGTTTYSYGANAALGLGIGTGGFTGANVVAAFQGDLTDPNFAGITINADTNISIDTIGGAATLADNIGVSTRGLEKILTGANLTVTGANQYSGRTVVWGGSGFVVNNPGNVGDASSNVGTNSTVDLMNSAFFQITAPAPVASSRNFNLLGNSILFGAGSTTNTINLSGNFSTETAGTKIIDFRTNVVGTHTTSGTISDGSGQLAVAKSNAGTWILSGNNTYTGGTSLNSGTLNINSATAIGTGPFNIPGNTFNNTSGGAITLSNNNVFNVTGNLTFTGTNDLSNGTGNFTINGTRNFTVSGGKLTLGGNQTTVVAGGIVKLGAGTLTLLGTASVHTGRNTLSAGVTEVSTMSNYGASSSLGAQGTNDGLWLNGGTLRYIGGSNVSTNRGFTLSTTAAAVIESSGVGTLSFDTPANALAYNGSGDRALILGGTNPGDNTFSKVLANSGGTTTFTKSDSGKWILTEANTYTGPTAINGGTLVLTGATQATSAITFSSGGILGLDISSPVTASSAVIDFTGQSVLVTGTPNLPSHTLLTASSLPGTAPTLASPAPSGYELQQVGNELRLVQIGGSPYSTWSGGPAADIDTNNDGVLNGVAWVIGAANPNEIVTDKVPTLDNTSDPDFFIFNYRRSDAAFADTNTAIKVEYGSDLTGWTPATAGPDIIINPLDDDFGPGIDRVEVKIRRTLAVGNKLFARLNVVVTP